MKKAVAWSERRDGKEGRKWVSEGEREREEQCGYE